MGMRRFHLAIDIILEVQAPMDGERFRPTLLLMVVAYCLIWTKNPLLTREFEVVFLNHLGKGKEARRLGGICEKFDREFLLQT